MGMEVDYISLQYVYRKHAVQVSDSIKHLYCGTSSILSPSLDAYKDQSTLSSAVHLIGLHIIICLGSCFQMLEGLGTKVEKDGLLDKYRKSEFNLIKTDGWSMLTKEFLKALPYSLTPSQLRAGDVGCGKTVVAFLACLEVIDLKLPQLLWSQPSCLLFSIMSKFKLISKHGAAECKPSVALWLARHLHKGIQFGRQGLQTGDISLVIGTHSLISEKVEFSALRIAVVDEQHRFGLYNNSINSKLSSNISEDSLQGQCNYGPSYPSYVSPPIPRSLALALYGDMSLTQITSHLPPGRIPVEAFVDSKVLQVLEKSSDGFYLANMDLVIRGPGDLLGKKQSGHLPEFPIARLEVDGNIIQDAHLAALQ
ncbi:hypothetical protein HAX54_013581 [Datura stramonium]|uniref:Uncharacterized protein n=1 Tax=Datura stramonium TaxID=4076 RepID=A0ABS8RYQ2_DATST|nr:hypothetical protein [Datura stramonium]